MSGAGASAVSRAGASARRGSADPVKALLHRHRELCERAVDPLEIAAGLEAHGVTDRTAARFRHRDVFSLAEELYARVPRDSGQVAATRTSTPADAPDRAEAPDRADARDAHRTDARAGARDGATDRAGRLWTRRAGTVLATLLPAAVWGLTLTGQALTTGRPRLAVTLAGALGLAVALAFCVRRGPLRTPGRTPVSAAAATTLLLLYAAYGDGLLGRLVDGAPDGPWPPATGPLLALTLALPPAAGCTRLFAVRARRRLAGSRGLDDFTARARPLFLAVVALYLTALSGLLVLTRLVPGAAPGPLVPALALGALLFLARLLTVHGFAPAGATALGAACAAQYLACAAVLAGRLPGLDPVAAPVRAVVETWGPAAVPALACGGAAAALLAYASTVLARASAHARP
ncbi:MULTISPECIES: hypothetical protein [Streptomyces]|uniref:Integral membrane protein n=1 Tax=Streptomyces changanensis TaxID=2964669 RepID=A0ABY5N9Y7_9ACTN|nr:MULTISPECIES: hypothetical protein [Streptomyces]UUS32832.1 hypothetical protein NRO40_19765 [Streptomyces changanensis]